ncbi:MAG: tetrahydromethanopterin S-methyltransferase subunit H [Candidatus Hodarchaeota archaeon]
MFLFKREQKIFEIDGIKIGGQPGQLPTVLIGSVFYNGMKQVRNHKKGIFDQDKIENYIRKAESLSEKTGNPHFLDVMASSPEAMINYLEFVSEITEIPFLIDGSNEDVRIAGTRYVNEAGLTNRAIWNSISLETTRKELANLKKCGIKSAVLLAFNPLNFKPEGRVEVLRGLLELAERSGIENILVDTTVLDMPSIGFAGQAIRVVKEIYGLPSGCAPANATYMWKKKKKDFLVGAFKSCDSATHTFLEVMAADFLIYGPIRSSRRVFKVSAMTDALIAHYMSQFVKPLTKNHPFYSIF